MASQDETVGQNVRTFRERMGLSQADLARELTEAGVQGFYPQTILKVEKGSRALKLVEGIFVAQLLGVRAEELYEPRPDHWNAIHVSRALMDLANAWRTLIDALKLHQGARATFDSLVADTDEEIFGDTLRAAEPLTLEAALKVAADNG